jgi:hypothetical protein
MAPKYLDLSFLYSSGEQVDIPYTVVDICGLDINDHGRSCNDHYTCGEFIDLHDVLYLNMQLEQFNGGPLEWCLKAYKVNPFTGLGGCQVGYLTKRYLYSSCIQSMSVYNGLYVYVDFDYRQDDLLPNREKSYNMNGIVRAKIIINHPNICGRNYLGGESIILDPDDPVYPLSKEKLARYDSSTDDEEEDEYEKHIRKTINKENRNTRLDKYYNEHPKNKPKATQKRNCIREVFVQ